MDFQFKGTRKNYTDFVHRIKLQINMKKNPEINNGKVTH